MIAIAYGRTAKGDIVSLYAGRDNGAAREAVVAATTADGKKKAKCIDAVVITNPVVHSFKRSSRPNPAPAVPPKKRKEPLETLGHYKAQLENLRRGLNVVGIKVAKAEPLDSIIAKARTHIESVNADKKTATVAAIDSASEEELAELGLAPIAKLEELEAELADSQSAQEPDTTSDSQDAEEPDDETLPTSSDTTPEESDHDAGPKADLE